MKDETDDEGRRNGPSDTSEIAERRTNDHPLSIRMKTRMINPKISQNK